MANIKWSAYSSETFAAGNTLVGLAGGVNVQFLADSFALNADNLEYLADAPTARTNLGLGSAAIYSASSVQTYVAAVDGAAVIGDFATYSDIEGTITDSGIQASDPTKAKMASVASAVSIGNIPVYSDVEGTISENTAALNNVANASATPGTIRAIHGEISSSIAIQTSGNLVGARGAVNYVGASGGFIYGAQGKIIPSGTLSGSSWNAGMFGQLDISAATINAGQMAPIWGDYGSASHILTNQSGLYGIAMTNTTAAVLAGQLYLYGGATNLMLLNTNSGLSGVTYFKNAGTTAGSWGNATPPTPSKVLTISVDGVQYYIPLVAQNT